QERNLDRFDRFDKYDQAHGQGENFWEKEEINQGWSPHSKHLCPFLLRSFVVFLLAHSQLEE
ncbi:MAG: hypothetical protein D6732_04760, partial [Methanobacteriota archaeon]